MVIDKNKYFKNINVKAKILSECALSIAKSDDNYVEWNGEFCSKWLDSKLVYSCCPGLLMVNNIAKIDHFSVFKMTPNKTYKLHVDNHRGVVINMLLEHEDSMCKFFSPTSASPGLGNPTVLHYQPNTLYLFNTQLPHMVENFAGTRYLFQTVFQEDLTTLLYPRVLAGLAKANLV